MKRQNQLNIKRGLLSKLVLLVALFLGSSNAWGDSFITINDSQNLTTNMHFPFYGSYANKSPLVGQYIIPSGDLSSIDGCNITKIVLYFSTASANWGDAEFSVNFKEVDNSTFPSLSSPTIVSEDLVEVFNGKLSVANNIMEITLSGDGYPYKGKNLLISFNQTKTGSSTTANCYVKSNTSTSGNFSNIAYQYMGYSSVYTYGEKYLPKMTIYYNGSGAPTDLEATNVHYNEATLGWTNGGEETQWQLVCSTTDSSSGDPILIDSNPYTITGLSENTTYYAYLRAYYDEDTQSEWTRTTFTTPLQYPTPTDFALTNFTSTTATFSWTNGEGTDPTSWQIKYSTTKGFNPDETGTLKDNVDSKPYTIEGLFDGTTYYARIRAYYGDSNYSSWNIGEVEFTPSSIINLVINDGSDKSYYMPIAGSSVSASSSSMIKSQFVIPAASLTDMRKRQITELTFHAENSSINWGTAKFEVYLNEVNYVTYASTSFGSWGTKVFNSGTLSVTGNIMSIVLDTPFNYMNGNLQIGIKQTETGSGSSSTWYSVKDGGYSNVAIYGTGTGATGTRTYYSPKVTITSIPISTDPVQMDDNGFTTYASPRPLDLTTTKLPKGLKAYKAEVDAENGKVRFTDINQKVAANTGILLAGTANETYNIPVADSGSEVTGNAFLVNSTGGTFAAEKGYTYFGFKKNSEPITFATFNPSTVAIPTNKAYLKVWTSDLPTEARQLVAVFDDGETTSLREIRNEELGIKNAVFFNLNGQRVAQPTKGLYIVNGKKVLVP